jgi:hypothetical protein
VSEPHRRGLEALIAGRLGDLSAAIHKRSRSTAVGAQFARRRCPQQGGMFAQAVTFGLEPDGLFS